MNGRMNECVDEGFTGGQLPDLYRVRLRAIALIRPYRKSKMLYHRYSKYWKTPMADGMPVMIPTRKVWSWWSIVGSIFYE
jgi:hypothetical protein